MNVCDPNTAVYVYAIRRPPFMRSEDRRLRLIFTNPPAVFCLILHRLERPFQLDGVLVTLPGKLNSLVQFVERVVQVRIHGAHRFFDRRKLREYVVEHGAILHVGFGDGGRFP